MADKTFIPTTGAQTWATDANWSGGTKPVTGDRVFVTSGDASLIITAGSTQAAVLLSEFISYDTFLGSMTIDVHATLERHGFPSGSNNGNSGSPKIIRDNGAAAGTVIVYKTGSSTDATIGLPAFRWTGTHASGNKMYVYGGSVGVGTDLSAAVLNDLDVLGGNVTIGQNATLRNRTITGGVVIDNGLSHASGTLAVSGGTVTTGGATLIPTITVVGGATANLNHRAASGDSAATVDVFNGGTVNLQGDPRPFAVTTYFKVYPGGTLQHFGLSQVTGSGVSFPTPGKVTAA